MNKKILTPLLSIIIVTGITFSSTGAWVGLTAQVGDVLNTAKWNEMITVLNTKLEINNIVAGTGITVDTSGNDVTISLDGGGVAPYINPENLTLVNNTSYTLDLEGVYFTPSTGVSLGGGGTVNTITALSPTALQIDITTGTTNGVYDIVLDNNGALNTIWPANGQNYITLIDPVTGTGPAGTYTETFEASLGNWVDGGGQESWLRDSGGTPSGGTGPNSGNGSTFYAYTETTGNGAGFPNRTFILETTHFNIAQSISFDYHAFGADMGVLELQTLHNGVWTTRNTISGQQQAAQGDAYLSTTVDLSIFPVQSIRFFYTSGTNYQGDFAIDNVAVVSN